MDDRTGSELATITPTPADPIPAFTGQVPGDLRQAIRQAVDAWLLRTPSPHTPLVSTQLPVFCNLFCCKRLGSFQWRRLPCQFQRHHG